MAGEDDVYYPAIEHWDQVISRDPRTGANLTAHMYYDQQLLSVLFFLTFSVAVDDPGQCQTLRTHLSL
jgi:hypothetical protein